MKTIRIHLIAALLCGTALAAPTPVTPTGGGGGGGAVDSVNGRTGSVIVTATDIGLDAVNNTADTAKPVSTAQQTALDGKQNLNANLTAVAGLVSAADKLPYFTGSGTAAVADLSAIGRTLLAQTTNTLMRSTLGLVIGTDVQAYDPDLASIAGNATGGFLTRTASNTYTPRTVAGTSNYVAVTNGDGVSGAPTIDLATRAKAAVDNVVFVLTIDALADSMDYIVGYVPAAFVITELRFVHFGTTSTPSITPTVKYGTDRTAGTSVVTSPSAVTSTTTGASVTSFNNSTPAANSWIWVTTASKSGTTDKFTVAVVGHY